MDVLSLFRKVVRRNVRTWGETDGARGFPAAGQGVFLPTYGAAAEAPAQRAAADHGYLERAKGVAHG